LIDYLIHRFIDNFFLSNLLFLLSDFQSFALVFCPYNVKCIRAQLPTYEHLHWPILHCMLYQTSVLKSVEVLIHLFMQVK